jgi:pilus assembly protein CpaB
MGRRTLLIIASVLVAAAGTAMIWLYVQGAEARARGKWQDLVTVLVARQAIPVGADQEVVRQRTTAVQVPRDFVSDQPIADAKVLGTRTTTMPVLVGQFLVEGQFASGNLPIGVPDNRMGAAFAMDDPNRVASLLRPGSQVAVYTTTTDKAGRHVENLLPKVTVLAVGTATQFRDAEGAAAKVGAPSNVSTALVTLDVDGLTAAKLIAHSGSLWFTLLGKGAHGSSDDTWTAPLGAGTVRG